MAARKSPKVIVPKTDEVLMPISMEDVQDKIIVLRGEPVILDRDVAELYGACRQRRSIKQSRIISESFLWDTFCLLKKRRRKNWSKILTGLTY